MSSSHLSEKDWYIPDRDRCTNPYAVVDEIFTMNKPEETLPPGYTAPPYPVGDYGFCSIITGYKDGIRVTGKAIMKPPGQSWDSIPGEPTIVKRDYPITAKSFKKTVPYGYDMTAGSFVLSLKGPAYDVRSGLDMSEFAHTEYRNGNMSIVGCRVPDKRLDPRFNMTEESLRSVYANDAASCPSESERSTSSARLE